VICMSHFICERDFFLYFVVDCIDQGYNLLF